MICKDTKLAGIGDIVENIRIGFAQLIRTFLDAD